MATEQTIIHDLMSKWVSLALEYARGADDVRAVYVYASSEGGSRFANVYFNQGGAVKHPDDLLGVDASNVRVGQVQDLLVDDLLEAEEQFAAIGVPKPTEYRIYFEPDTRKLDVQLSREEVYGDDIERSPIRGIEYWLGERAPKLFG